METLTGTKSPEEQQAMERFEAGNNVYPAAVEAGKEVSSTPEKESSPLEKNEAVFLAEFKARAESNPRAAKLEHNYSLETRYNDEYGNAANVLAEVGQFAVDNGFQSEITPDMEKVDFNAETSSQILAQAERQIDTLINNPEKHKALLEEVTAYLDLIQRAQLEQDLPQPISMADVAKTVETNISTLTLQDRIASANLLGDHGIRHIVSHNINVTRQLFDELERNGQEIRAVDRLMAHQIMIDHDLGYAMAPVRESINRDGINGQDAGHSLLGAKFIRQRGEDANDPMSRLFSKEQFAAMHEGIMHHDSTSVQLHLNDSSVQERQENLYSFIHLADNTDAFESKLPELIYSLPESLKFMRLLKTAGEIGDNEMVNSIKEQLKQEIEARADWSQDDKDAIIHAVGMLTADDYKFTVGRICGNNPEFSINSGGQVEIIVQESVIHQEVVGLYDQKAYDQLKKFIADLTGIKKDQIDLDQDQIETPAIMFRIAKGETNKSHEMSDYESRIEGLIKEPSFTAFASADRDLSIWQKKSEARKTSQETILREKTDITQEEKDSIQAEIDRIQDEIDKIRVERRALLEKYQNGGI